MGLFNQYISQPLELSPTQFVLGDFVFSLPENSPIESMARTFDGGWVTIDLLNELPLQQQTGRKLDEIRFNCSWFKDEGTKNIGKLLHLMEQNKPLSLVRGDGTNMGQFTIRGFSTDETWMHQEGKTMKQVVTINLLEFANKPIEQKSAGKKASTSTSSGTNGSK
ncbi:phage tail protein [Salmonella enterica]|nr:phage tail protein [Salmonella enterica]EIK0943998.1 phage tail protein [Salmonella enterica]